MRFGKKLALQVMDDQTGAPYLSHKPMKEAINRTVRELRLYQARVQGTEHAWQDGGAGSSAANAGMAPPTPAELAELEERIACFDRQLFQLVDDDLSRIYEHVRFGEAHMQGKIAAFQTRLIESGLLIDDAQLQRLESVLPLVSEDRTELCKQLLALRIRSDPMAMATDLQSLAADYNSLVEVACQHSQYLEINVAGFRKLLKRHEKQIPQKFRSRAMPCLGFHRLVTHTSRQLLALTEQLKGLLLDARQRFDEIVSTGEAAQVKRTTGQWGDLQEPRGLGPECEMVLNIQRQLKDPMNSQLMQVAADFSEPCPGFLYPKPGIPARSTHAQPTQAKSAIARSEEQAHMMLEPPSAVEHLSQHASMYAFAGMHHLDAASFAGHPMAADLRRGLA
mmetsp:Transcript_3874/g.9364  ORF Transcript_3874/g.9364 Transcript_3874/m.9364 type:complete len:393 (-) Transcript_3874:551-1729(-)